MIDDAAMESATGDVLEIAKRLRAQGPTRGRLRTIRGAVLERIGRDVAPLGHPLLRWPLVLGTMGTALFLGTLLAGLLVVLTTLGSSAVQTPERTGVVPLVLHRHGVEAPSAVIAAQSPSPPSVPTSPPAAQARLQPQPPSSTVASANAASPQRAADSSPDDISEAVLLARARQALTSNPEHTLMLVRTHLRRFPHSLLQEERDVLELDALSALHDARVRARAAHFLAAYPTSVHVSHVRALAAEATH